MLFLIYINDLPNISNKLKFYLFADDTNIFYQSNDLNNLQNVLNKELKKLSLWLNANRLALNISKTNFVIFSPKNKPLTNVTLLIDKKAIEEKDHVKYLGVLIDSKLTFKTHITELTIKISRTIGLMSKIRHYTSNKALRIIYNSLIYPFLLYGIPIWGNANKTLINPIFILQKRAVRIILNKNNYIQTYYRLPGYPDSIWLVDTFIKESAEPLFKILNLLNIFDIFKIETLKFVYSSINRISPTQFQTYFNFPSYLHQTTGIRNKNLIIPQVRTTTYGLKSIKYTGAYLWNNLHLDNKSLSSKNLFIKSIKKDFLEKYA